ncbi:MAG: multiple antibiotic resistance protein [Akkermansiaceae bacterium]|jgi:multiple antibiotic resistance protein
MLSLAILLFVVMDPFGNLVPVNSMLSKYPPPARRKIILRESLIALGIMLAAVYGGKMVLEVLGLEGHSLSISGGIVLFVIALGMLFPRRGASFEDEETDDPFIVPIAMPLIAGPSTLSMVILFGEKHSVHVVAGAVLLASLASILLLVASPKIFEFLGHRGARALERLMGMLLIMIAVQMTLDGFKAYFASGV